MLTTLAVIALHKGAAGGILAKVLTALIVGISVAVPNWQRKNSGILRFLYGLDPGTSQPPANAAAGPLSGQVSPTVLNKQILTVLGADADLIYDADYQAFGESPGHAAITGTANTLFSGINLVQRDMTPLQPKIQPDPNTGLPPFNTVNVLYSGAGARIPAGTKVLAWFEMSDFTHISASVADEAPIVCVQTEVVQNQPYKAGVLDPTGPQWLSSIRVAIVNNGAAGTLAAGILYVKLQHSHLDIPATTSQNSNLKAIGGG